MALIFIVSKLRKTLPVIIAEVEELAQDGVIDAKDRKRIAVKAINVVAAEFDVAIGWIPRIIISFMINKIAKKLPSKDIVVEDILEEVVAEEPKKKRAKKNFGPKRK